MRRATVGLIVLLAALSIAIGAVAAPAGGLRQAAARVKVTLGQPGKEFSLVPSPTSAKAGKVTFVVTNKGKMEHEFVVIKTNKAPGKLPMEGDEASEKGAVGEIGSVKPGQTRRVTLTLKAGKHVLICNLPGHYKAGQYAGFRAT
jgi:uncharacterized cupredoxin-like copper-binding protein